MSAPNLIHGLTLDVAWEGSVEAGESLADWLREALLPVIEQVLSRSAVAGQVRRVERLEVDLGMVTRDDAEDELPNRLLERLTDALRWPAQAGPQLMASGVSDASSVREPGVPDSPGEQLLGFLRSGRLPWSVAADRQVAHEQLLRRVLATRQAAVVLSEVVRDEHMLARLVRQFSAAVLSEVVAVLHPGQVVSAAATEAQWSAALQGQGAAAPELDKFMAWRQHQLDLDEQALPLADLQQWLIWWLMHDSSLVNQDCSLMLESIGAQCGQAPDPARFMQLVLSTLRAGGQLDLEELARQSDTAAERPAAMDAITTLKSQAAIRNFVAQHAAEDKRLGNLNSAQLHQLVRGWIGEEASLFLGAIESRALQTGDAHGYFHRILQSLLEAREIDLEAACGGMAYLMLGSGAEEVRFPRAATEPRRNAGSAPDAAASTGKKSGRRASAPNKSGKNAIGKIGTSSETSEDPTNAINNPPEADAVPARPLSGPPDVSERDRYSLSTSPKASASQSLSTSPETDEGHDRSLSALQGAGAGVARSLSTSPDADAVGDRPLSTVSEAGAGVSHSLSNSPDADEAHGRSLSALQGTGAGVARSLSTSPDAGAIDGRPFSESPEAGAGVGRSLSNLSDAGEKSGRLLSASQGTGAGVARSLSTSPDAGAVDGHPLSTSPEAGAGVSRSLSTLPDAGAGCSSALSASPDAGAGVSRSLSNLSDAGEKSGRPLSTSPEAGAGVSRSLSTLPDAGTGCSSALSASPEAGAGLSQPLSNSPDADERDGRSLSALQGAGAGVARSLSTWPDAGAGVSRSLSNLSDAGEKSGRSLSASHGTGAGIARSPSTSPDAGESGTRSLGASSKVDAAAAPASAGEAKAAAEEGARGSSPLPALLQQNLPQRLASAMLQADLTSLEIIWPEITRYHADVLLAAALRYLRRPQERANLAARAPTDMLIAMLKAISPSATLLIEPVIRHADACNAVLGDPLPPDEFRQRSLHYALDCALSADLSGSLISLIQTLAPKHAKPDDIRQIAHAWRAILPVTPALDSALFGARYVQAIQEHLRAPEDGDTPPAVYALLSEEVCQHYPDLLEAPLREQLEASISTARQPALIAKGKNVTTPARGSKKARQDGGSQKKSRQRKQNTDQQLAAPPAAIIQAESTLAILLMRADEPGKPEQLTAELMLQRLLGAATTLTGALETALSQPTAISRLVDMTPGAVLAQLLVRLQPELAAQLPQALRAIASQTGIANIPALQANATWKAIYQAAFVAADPVTPAEFIRTLVRQTAGPDTPLPDATPGGGSASDIMRTLLQPMTRAEEQQAPAAQEEPQTQQGDANLRNAGMVIFATYAQRLFSILELTKDGNFVSEEAAQRAVHLLQYAVTAETSTPEYQLVLNKLLCGIHGGQPIARGIDITDKEKDTIEQMLNGVIAHWKALGKTSISGLRQTFLQREGQLTFEEDAWHLKIPTATFDMLLDRLPWSFAMIKFPWMEHPLHVTWR